VLHVDGVVDEVGKSGRGAGVVAADQQCLPPPAVPCTIGMSAIEIKERLGCVRLLCDNEHGCERDQARMQHSERIIIFRIIYIYIIIIIYYILLYYIIIIYNIFPALSPRCRVAGLLSDPHCSDEADA
jgi:hypothetical protein